MDEECFFKKGETYKNLYGNEFTVISIGFMCVYTDVPVDSSVNWFYLNTFLYKKLIEANTAYKKSLSFACGGSYWICCDYNILENGEFRTYAYLVDGRIEYIERYRKLLDETEIATIESFADTLESFR